MDLHNFSLERNESWKAEQSKYTIIARHIINELVVTITFNIEIPLICYNASLKKTIIFSLRDIFLTLI